MDTNVLYYGDNLEILRGEYIPTESVDLIYIDPPFNSNQAYNVFLPESNGTLSQAQIRAFDDTWHWTDETQQIYSEIMKGPRKIAKCIESFRNFLEESNMMAYLTMMTPRLIELHRVLKPTGSFYLHCDPTASHYLKIILDQVFGIKNFQNEITWCYTRPSNIQKRFPRVHHVIFFYTKSDKWIFNRDEIRIPYHPESKARSLRGAGTKSVMGIKGSDRLHPEGKVPEDWWVIPELQGNALERLEYPTQKPEALLERIIKVSSNEGDVVLDAFAGCGTTIAVAQRLKRRWIGIDITHIAIAVIKNRLQNTFGDSIKYKVIGEPQDLASARALAKQDPHEFEKWAVGLVGGRPLTPGGKKGADKGIDGIIPLGDIDPHNPKKAIRREIILQVKSGKVSVRDIRDLRGVIEREKAIIGVLITLEDPTQPMVVEAIKADYYERWGQKYPKIQIRTIEELFQNKGIEYPDLKNTNFKEPKKIKSTPEIQTELSL